MSDFEVNKDDYRTGEQVKYRNIQGRVPDAVHNEALQSANIIEFAEEYLGVSFKERPAQEVILRSQYGLPLDAKQMILYEQLTQQSKEHEPGVEKMEGNYAIGARGGKSTMVSIIAAYEATRDRWRQYLQPKEIGYVVIIATRLQQAEDIIQAKCAGLMLDSPKLKRLVKQTTKTQIELKNGITIASFPCNSLAARGYPIICLIFDELAHYRIEGPKADELIYNALHPRISQFPQAKCMKISTPLAKQGLFWNEFDEGFKVPGRLTIQAPTRIVNPVIPQGFIDKEYERDPDNAEREFGAVFSETAVGFFAGCGKKLDLCFQEPDEDMPYKSSEVYFAAADQSGLAGKDRFGFGISHKDTRSNKIVVDCVRQWETEDADWIMEEILAIMTRYHTRDIDIDRYAQGWVENALNKRGLVANVRDRLPVIYTNFRTLVIASRLVLPEHGALRIGLTQTQGYYSKSNNLSIGHPRTIDGHGDVADAVVSSVFQASRKTMDYSYYEDRQPELVGAKSGKGWDYDVNYYGL